MEYKALSAIGDAAAMVLVAEGLAAGVVVVGIAHREIASDQIVAAVHAVQYMEVVGENWCYTEALPGHS